MEQSTLVTLPHGERAQAQANTLTAIRALPVLLSIITLALGLIYLAVIPPWGGPDEPRHYEYVRLLHEKGRLVGYSDIDKNVMNQIIRSMDAVNYWNWGVSLWTRAKPGELPKDFAEIYSNGTHQLHQPPLAYLLYLPALKAFAASPIESQLYAMRLISILLNIVTVLAAYVAGREIFRDDPTMALAIPVFIMLLPQHLFLHSTVMNDHLTEAAIAWMLAIMARTFRLGLSLPRALGILVLLGIGLAAKRSALFGIPIVGFGFVVYALSHWGRQLSARQKFARLGLTALVLVVGAIGFVGAWLFIQAYVPKLYEYITKSFLFLPSEQFPWEWDPRMVDIRSLPQYASSLKRIFVSTWGHFGWMNITLGVWAYWGFAVLCVLASIGLAIYALRDFRQLQNWQRAALLVFASAVVFAITLIMGLEIRYWTLGWDAGSQGRYLFPVLIPLATLFLLGTRSFFPRSRYLVWFGALLAAMILYNIVALGFFIIPFYRV